MRVWKVESSDKMEETKKRKSLEEKAARKRARAEEKHKIMAELPKVDENGISYTKQQLRRMRKRVTRGLNPIETPAEENDRKVREAQLKREEEAELAGLIVAKDKTPIRQEVGDKESSDEEEETAKDASSDQEDEEEEEASKAASPKKKKRNKEVPLDYVCSACKNETKPAHWIYDCPKKKTVRGTNQKSKKLRGLHDPSDNKLFVSGLPFEATVGSVKSLFEKKSGITPTFVKLVKFKDSERCKGQAYVSFATASAAKEARELDGTLIPNTTKPESRKKDLKLTVGKVLNRSATTTQTSIV